MKRIIYITYLSLLALFLISCDKEIVAPDAAAEDLSFNTNRGGAACPNYTYQSKTGVVQLGSVGGDLAIIGFKPSVTQAQQQAILSQYPIYNNIEGEAFFESGIGTIVRFVPGTTCRQAENFAAQIAGRQAVDYVLPVFAGTGNFSGYDWVSPSPELIVTLKNPQQYRFLEQFARNTKTQIVTSFDNVTYILAANKKSSGTILELSSQLNASPKVDSAEPNFYGQMGSFRKSLKHSEAIALIQQN